MQSCRLQIDARFPIVDVQVKWLSPHHWIAARFEDHQRIACTIFHISDAWPPSTIEKSVLSEWHDIWRQELVFCIPSLVVGAARAIVFRNERAAERQVFA